MNALMPAMAGLLALCAELFFREAFALTTWSPDFVTVILLWLGVTRGWTVGAIVSAAVIGLLTDGFVGSPLGLHMLHAVLLTFLAGFLTGRIRHQGLLGRLLLGGAGGLVSLFLLVAVCRIFLGDTAIGDRVGAILLPRTAVIVLALPLLFPILDRLDRLGARRKDGDLN